MFFPIFWQPTINLKLCIVTFFGFNNWHFYSKINITIGLFYWLTTNLGTVGIIEVTHCSWSKLSQFIVMFLLCFVTFHEALLILPQADCIRQVSGSCYRLLSWPYITPAQEMALCLLFRPVFFFFLLWFTSAHLILEANYELCMGVVCIGRRFTRLSYAVQAGSSAGAWEEHKVGGVSNAAADVERSRR